MDERIERLLDDLDVPHAERPSLRDILAADRARADHPSNGRTIDAADDPALDDRLPIR